MRERGTRHSRGRQTERETDNHTPRLRPRRPRLRPRAIKPATHTGPAQSSKQPTQAPPAGKTEQENRTRARHSPGQGCARAAHRAPRTSQKQKHALSICAAWSWPGSADARVAPLAARLMRARPSSRRTCARPEAASEARIDIELSELADLVDLDITAHSQPPARKAPGTARDARSTTADVAHLKVLAFQVVQHVN